MSTTETLLAAHPHIGLIASAVGFVMPFFQQINPLVQFCVGCTGLAIGLLTLESKWKERKRKKRTIKKADYE